MCYVSLYVWFTSFNILISRGTHFPTDCSVVPLYGGIVLHYVDYISSVGEHIGGFHIVIVNSVAINMAVQVFL